MNSNRINKRDTENNINRNQNLTTFNRVLSNHRNEQFIVSDNFNPILKQMYKNINTVFDMTDKIVDGYKEELWKYVHMVMKRPSNPIIEDQKRILDNIKDDAIPILKQEIILLSKEKYKLEEAKTNLHKLDQYLMENLKERNVIITSITESLMKWQTGYFDNIYNESNYAFVNRGKHSIKLLENRIIELVLERKKLEKQYNEFKSKIMTVNEKMVNVDFYLDRVITALENYNNEIWNKK